MKTITTSFIAITSLFIFWFLRPPLDYVVKAKKPDSHPPQHTISIKKDKANAVSVKGNQTTKPHSGVLLSSGEDNRAKNTALVINSTLLNDFLSTSTTLENQYENTTTSTSTQVSSTTTSVDNTSSTTTTSSTTPQTDVNDKASTTKATTTNTTPKPTPEIVHTPTPVPTTNNSQSTTTPILEVTPTPTPEIKPTPLQTVTPKENATGTAGIITDSGKNFLNFLNSFLSVEQASVPASNPYYFQTLKPETTRVLLIISGLFTLLGLLFITPRRDRAHFKHYAKQQ